MSVLMTIVGAFGEILAQLLNLYTWVIIIAALISWVRPDPYNPIVQILYRLTEPLYDLIRRFIRTTFQGIDFAPIIVLFAIQLIIRVPLTLLINWANGATITM